MGTSIEVTRSGLQSALSNFHCASRHQYRKLVSCVFWMSLTIAVHYSEGDSTAFCNVWNGPSHSNERIDEMEDAWLKSLKLRGADAVDSSEFGVRGVAYILRGLAETWEMKLWSMSIDLRDGLLGPDSIPVTDTREHIEMTIKWSSSRPVAANKRELSVYQHITLLNQSMTRIGDTLAGEAHIYRTAVAATEFFSFLRCSIVWCMYMGQLGYEPDAFTIVLLLHGAGLSHSTGNEEVESAQRARVLETMKSTRGLMYRRFKPRQSRPPSLPKRSNRRTAPKKRKPKVPCRERQRDRSMKLRNRHEEAMKRTIAPVVQESPTSQSPSLNSLVDEQTVAPPAVSPLTLCVGEGDMECICGAYTCPVWNRYIGSW
jgi:hypothetical protein